MKILLFSGSLRKDSLNKKLIAATNQILLSAKLDETVIIDLQPLLIPVYDADIEANGIPDGVLKLGQEITQSEALIISSPEYNGAIAGSLKNTIDWISRIYQVPLMNKPLLLMGASPGYFGSISALGTTKAPFENLGCFVFPQTFALPNAAKVFSESGALDEHTTKQLATLLISFRQFATKLIT